MCSMSATKPSDTSAALRATPTKSRPSSILASGNRYRLASVLPRSAGKFGSSPKMYLRPKAASPIVPETYSKSPARAVDRRNSSPSLIAPNAVTVMLRGPGEATVSPPTRCIPAARWSRASRLQKHSNHDLAWSRFQARGSTSDNVYTLGMAPIAARSDRFTASALAATASGGSDDRKWISDTMVSVVTTTRWPNCNGMMAASSNRPRAPGSPAARGAKNWDISSNSLSRSTPIGAIRTFRQFRRTEFSRKLIQNGIHEGWFLASEKRMGHIHIFVDHYF